MNKESRDNNVVLGIGDCFHDNGIATVKDGRLTYAINEERLSRNKFDTDFKMSLDSLTKVLGLNKKNISFVAVGGVSSFNFIFLQLKSILKRIIKQRRFTGIIKGLGLCYVKYKYNRRARRLIKNFALNVPVINVEHHLCHAASAFYTSGFKEATVITADGTGDGISSAIYVGSDSGLRRLTSIDEINSMGIFYSAVTSLLGFKPLRHEGKITGLAAYGHNNECYNLVKTLLDINNGDIRLNHKYFCFDPFGESFFKRARFIFNTFIILLKNLFSGRQKCADTSYEVLSTLDLKYYSGLLRSALKNKRREDISYAFQKRLEEVASEFVRYAVARTGIKNVVLVGGTFANVRVNQEIAEMDCVEQLFIYPHMGDGGIAAGAALYAFHNCIRDSAPNQRSYFLRDVYIGLSYSEKEILAALGRFKNSLSWQKKTDVESIIAKYIHEGKVVGRFNGAMEYGPRALGNRSILYKPTDRTINDWLNKRLQRTEFMPFAPSTLFEYRDFCYKIIPGTEHTAEFMTITYDCTDWMKQNCPAAVHVDGTARPQLVKKEVNPSYYKIIDEYRNLSGIPCVVNTSFNMHEEPIVCSPEDAIEAFMVDAVDVLILEDYVVTKKC